MIGVMSSLGLALTAINAGLWECIRTLMSLGEGFGAGVLICFDSLAWNAV
jgi:hypothetical protein